MTTPNNDLLDCMRRRQPFANVWAPGLFYYFIHGLARTDGVIPAIFSASEMKFHGNCDNLSMSKRNCKRLQRGEFRKWDSDAPLYYSEN